MFPKALAFLASGTDSSKSTKKKKTHPSGRSARITSLVFVFDNVVFSYQESYEQFKSTLSKTGFWTRNILCFVFFFFHNCSCFFYSSFSCISLHAVQQYRDVVSVYHNYILFLQVLKELRASFLITGPFRAWGMPKTLLIQSRREGVGKPLIHG